MPRRMSCSMTIDAVRDRTKEVTRRHPDTWATLAPGDTLTLIEKGMGLPKGAKQVVLAEVEVVDVRLEPISDVLSEPGATAAEGLPDPRQRSSSSSGSAATGVRTRAAASSGAYR